MSIKSDRWIRRMAAEHGMIEPFEPGQVRTSGNGRKIISYGTSSYGYDVRCADEFKIFTNINSTIVDPKNFDAEVIRRFQGRRFASSRRTRLRWRARWSTSAFRASANGLPRKIDVRALRHHRQRDASGARVGRPRDAGILQYHAAAGKESTPTKAWRRCCSSSRTRFARPPTRTAAESTRVSAASRCRRPEPRLRARAALLSASATDPDRELELAVARPLGLHRHETQIGRKPHAQHPAVGRAAPARDDDGVDDPSGCAASPCPRACT